MDLNSILSLIGDQKSNSPENKNNQSQSSINLDNVNLSSISQDVIQQVRQEYLSKQQPMIKEDKVKNATSITPEVLVALGNMVKETNLIQVLKHCKERQDKKERELFAHRETIKERYKKQKDNLLAKELIGVKVDQKEIQALDREMSNELHRMDLQVLKDMDGEMRYLQSEFVKLSVPLFKVTNDVNVIKLQQKVLFILQDMI